MTVITNGRHWALTDTLVIQRIKGPVLLHKGTKLLEFLKETESFRFELVVQLISVIQSFL